MAKRKSYFSAGQRSFKTVHPALQHAAKKLSKRGYNLEYNPSENWTGGPKLTASKKGRQITVGARVSGDKVLGIGVNGKSSKSTKNHYGKYLLGNRPKARAARKGQATKMASKMNRSDAMRKAWATRKKLYGNSGSKRRK